MLEIEPYGIQWKALELLKEAREETGFALLFANAENPFLTNEAQNKMKMEYLEREAKKMKALDVDHEICERLLKISSAIISSRRRISNEKDVYKAVDSATGALDSAYESVISLVLAVRPWWTTEEKEEEE